MPMIESVCVRMVKHSALHRESRMRRMQLGLTQHVLEFRRRNHSPSVDRLLESIKTGCAADLPYPRRDTVFAEPEVLYTCLRWYPTVLSVQAKYPGPFDAAARRPPTSSLTATSRGAPFKEGCVRPGPGPREEGSHGACRLMKSPSRKAGSRRGRRGEQVTAELSGERLGM